MNISSAAVVIVFEYCVIEVLLTCSAGKLRLIWTGPTGSLNQFDTLGKDHAFILDHHSKSMIFK